MGESAATPRRRIRRFIEAVKRSARPECNDADWSLRNRRNAQMNDRESICTTRQSQAEPCSRTRAKAKITVQRSEAKPYDQTVSPTLMEIRLTETFSGDIDGESPVRALQVLRDDTSASLVSMQRFRGKLGGRQGTFVLQGSEIVRTARSRRYGSSFLDRGQVSFPGCAARAALKANLEKDRTERWTIGSSDGAVREVRSGRLHHRLAPDQPRELA
jgi:Protein of unknown function (DUF3224)